MTAESLAPHEPIQLRDGDLVLRPFNPRDLDALAVAFADPELAQWNPGPSGGSAEALGDWIEGRADWTSGDHASWAVSDTTGELLGSVSLFHIDQDQREAEIGYWVTPSARGRGLANRAVRLAAGFAFGTLQIRRIVLYHAVENVASCRVANAAGFQLEGTMRESHRYGDGAYHDEHIHGRLAADVVAGARAR